MKPRIHVGDKNKIEEIINNNFILVNDLIEYFQTEYMSDFILNSERWLNLTIEEKLFHTLSRYFYNGQNNNFIRIIRLLFGDEDIEDEDIEDEEEQQVSIDFIDNYEKEQGYQEQKGSGKNKFYSYS